MQKEIAQKFRNLAHKLDGKGKIIASDWFLILSDEILDTLSEVNECLLYFD
ncbi:hypothetical protein [Blautia sp. 1033sp1_1033st1_G9_1033SCRN_220408]|uniref:hypothetical protein n=1 Tax=Blautia sp. 1033sp1_1033st1_G9_1033SCRN_220408 TaxID=3144490 RepID=UPI0034A2E538